MITSKLTPASLDTRSSSLARPSGRNVALSKSNNASAANVTFSLVGAGGAGGAGGGGGGGAGAGGGGGGSQTSLGIRSLSHTQPIGNGLPSIFVALARSKLQNAVRQQRPNGFITTTPFGLRTYGLSRGSTTLMSFCWARLTP